MYTSIKSNIYKKIYFLSFFLFLEYSTPIDHISKKIKMEIKEQCGQIQKSFRRYHETHGDNLARVFGLKGRNGGCSFKIMTSAGGRWHGGGVSINVRYHTGRATYKKFAQLPSSSPVLLPGCFPYWVTYCFHSALSG